MTSISKETINALLPPGNLYEIEPGGDLDLLFDAIAEEYDDTADFLADLQYIRNPNKTPVFTDLEREFGIRPNTNVAMAARIARLSRKVYLREKIGSIDDLQDALDIANFDLQVHLNDPPVDPAIFIDQDFNMVAGGSNAHAGFTDGVDILAFAGLSGGEWLVNPDIFLQAPAVGMQAGGAFAYAGHAQAVAGYFTGLNAIQLEYDTPAMSQYWPMCFFVGGDATRNALGELTSVALGYLPNERRDELRTLILNIKPVMSWCGLVIAFT